MVTPAQRRTVVTEMRAAHALAVQQSCRYLGVHRALLTYRRHRDPQVVLRAALVALAVTKPRWGSPRLTWRLRRDGWVVNHKRVARLLREEHLLVGQRPRRKRVAVPRVASPAPRRPDERWSMDFMRDTTTDGRPFRIWTVVDDCTRESPMVRVGRSLPAAQVIDALEALLLVRGRPTTIVCDNGPEFVSLALDQWASQHGVALDFIRPGRPVENCFIESFNGRLRDECLNQHHFTTLAEAIDRIDAWRQEYNTARPHRGLGLRTPAEYAQLFTPEEGHSSPRHSEAMLS